MKRETGKRKEGNHITRRTFQFVLVFIFLLTLFPSAPAERLIPFEKSGKKTLRVMTYNIHVGVGIDKKLDIGRIAAVISNEHPDLVGLQEVDRGVKRTELKDEIVELAKLTGMEYAFAHNLDYQGGQYGVAILSRFPIQKVDHRKYENLREAERRGMIRAEIKLDRKLINFVTTHLDYQHEDGRVFETQQMLKFLEGVKGPLIVVGDFNDEPSGAAYKLMQTSFADSWSASKATEEGLTYPADKPVKRIDYVFTRQSDRIRARRAWKVNTLASDHLPVVADLQLR